MHRCITYMHMKFQQFVSDSVDLVNYAQHFCEKIARPINLQIAIPILKNRITPHEYSLSFQT